MYGEKIVPPVARYRNIILYSHDVLVQFSSFFFLFISYHLSVAFFEDDKFRHDSPGAPRRQLCNVHELARALSSFYGTRTCAKPLTTTSDTHTHSLSRAYNTFEKDDQMCVCVYAVISEYNERIHRIRFSRLTPLCACIGGGSHVMHES